MQWNLRKIEKFAKRVPLKNPHLSDYSSEWDSMSLHDWCSKNLWTSEAHSMFNIVSFAIISLYFLF